MNHRTRLFSLALAAAGLAACTSRTATAPAAARVVTALDRYVAAPDPAYEWKLASTTRGDGVTVHVLEMTSQSWLSPEEVDRTLWRHWLHVIEPDEIAHSTALVYIGGGENGESKPRKAKKELVLIAKASRSLVAELSMVPNQPLVFEGDGVARVEDDLVAYTWDKFLRTGDERWPARLPMTKAVVRAMDTVSAFAASEALRSATEASGDATASARSAALASVDRFVVAGMSKRGWTTWTTAAVDPRVVAICPMVIDVLNMQPSMEHHFQAYGFWAPAVRDYVEHGIMAWLGTSQMRALLAIEEPFEYRDRLTLPKLALNSAGDQFFAPDSSQFYFDALTGPKYLRYVPNCDHSLKGTDAFQTLLAWHDAVSNGRPLPRFSWTHADGEIHVRTIDRPRAAKLWQARNPDARDFRLETLGPAWRASELSVVEGGTLVARIEPADRGWTAGFVELEFDLGAAAPLVLTTDVRVYPATLPSARPASSRAAPSSRSPAPAHTGSR